VELTTIEMARLRTEDGLGTEADIALLNEDGVDVEADARLRTELQWALSPAVVPSIADLVLSRLGVEGLLVQAALDDGDTPSLADSVMAAVGAGNRPGKALKTAIEEEAGEPESIWPAIAASVGADPGFDLGATLKGAIQSESAYQPAGWLGTRPPWWRVGAVSVALAIAAALLLWVGGIGNNVTTMVDATLQPILAAPVQIESLEVGAANLAQVLQFGVDAPTIIFVSDDAEEAK
jgi:hypothetical protein